MVSKQCARCLTSAFSTLNSCPCSRQAKLYLFLLWFRNTLTKCRTKDFALKISFFSSYPIIVGPVFCARLQSAHEWVCVFWGYFPLSFLIWVIKNKELTQIPFYQGTTVRTGNIASFLSFRGTVLLKSLNVCNTWDKANCDYNK